MKNRNQWGIARPHGNFEWEEDMTARRSGTPPIASDQDDKDPVLLVDPKSRPILVRTPRPLGFRRP